MSENFAFVLILGGLIEKKAAIVYSVSLSMLIKVVKYSFKTLNRKRQL